MNQDVEEGIRACQAHAFKDQIELKLKAGLSMAEALKAAAIESHEIVTDGFWGESGHPGPQG